MSFTPLHIEYLPIAGLKRLSRSARIHPQKQIRKLAGSIEEFGFVCPVLLDEQGRIIAGNARVQAAKLAGLQELPCIRVEHLNVAQKRAFALFDNRITEDASWDENILAEELNAILELDAGFDMTFTGFELGEVDRLIEGHAAQSIADPAAEDLPAKDTVPERCDPGDVWRLGPHRLMCGDAQDPAVADRLMNGDVARMVFTDPPYNVPINGHVSGLGKVQHEDFAMACGEMDTAQFTNFLEAILDNHARHASEGSIHFVCMDWRHIAELLAAGARVYDEFKNLIVWNKGSGGMGAFYRSQHELVCVFKKGRERHVNTFGLGEHGRYRTNVWSYPGVSSFGAGREAALNMHPTVKPVAMIADAIRDVSRKGDIVLDLFGGSGSTLIAAGMTGRRGYLCELDPGYCDVILARWESYTGGRAERVTCGRPELGDVA